ncbi:unnamed protein product, partial [marine sediment metagenome]
AGLSEIKKAGSVWLQGLNRRIAKEAPEGQGLGRAHKS